MPHKTVIKLKGFSTLFMNGPMSHLTGISVVYMFCHRCIRGQPRTSAQCQLMPKNLSSAPFGIYLERVLTFVTYFDGADLCLAQTCYVATKASKSFPFRFEQHKYHLIQGFFVQKEDNPLFAKTLLTIIHLIYKVKAIIRLMAVHFYEP